MGYRDLDDIKSKVRDGARELGRKLAGSECGKEFCYRCKLCKIRNGYGTCDDCDNKWDCSGAVKEWIE